MDQIEEVRRKTDLVGLVSQSVSLKKAGRNFKGLCPFHDEKTPSFMVSPERQIFKCFGCGEGGDVYGWLMKREGMEFGEALRFLADKAGVELKSYQPSENQKIKDRLLEINHLASEYYHFLLTSHNSGKKALNYLLKRGIAKSSMRLFKLGYAPSEWEGLQGFLVRKKGYKAQELEQAGLVIKSPNRQNSYYDRFRGRIMFSLFDHRGRVVGFSGRVMEQNQKEAKYVNSPETLLYHKSAVLYGLEITKEKIKKANRAVVVEGEIDAISSFQAGVKNVVAIKGSALTAEQIELIKRLSDSVALALDNDTAGDSAARRGIELAEKAGLNVRVIKLKHGKDPDECAQKSSRLWKDSVKTAVPVYDFYIESAVKRYGVDSVEGKRKISEELAIILAKISNQVVKAHYVKKLALKLGVGEEAVSQEVNKASEKREAAMPVKKLSEPRSRTVKLEEYGLALVLQVGSEVKKLTNKVELDWLSEAAVKKVIERLKQWFGKGNKWEINRFVGSLPEELVRAVDGAYLTDIGSLAEDTEKLEKELERVIREIGKINLKDKLEKLTKAIREAEKNKDKVTVMKLQKEFVKASKDLKG